MIYTNNTCMHFLLSILFFFLQYIGSFSVSGEDQNARAEAVQKQLDEMKVSTIHVYIQNIER